MLLLHIPETLCTTTGLTGVYSIRDERWIELRIVVQFYHFTPQMRSQIIARLTLEIPELLFTCMRKMEVQR